jgi:hypothetical protein
MSTDAAAVLAPGARDAAVGIIFGKNSDSVQETVRWQEIT